MTPAEREFMMGGHMAGPSMLSPTSRVFGKIRGGIFFAKFMNFLSGDAAVMGRKITVEGVKDLSDDMIGRYFSKFGILLEWTRDETGTSG